MELSFAQEDELLGVVPVVFPPMLLLPQPAKTEAVRSTPSMALHLSRSLRVKPLLKLLNSAPDPKLAAPGPQLHRAAGVTAPSKLPAQMQDSVPWFSD